MPWHKLFAVVVLVPLAMAAWMTTYRLLMIPNAVSKKWQRLSRALRAVKKGTATGQDLEVVASAKRLGLLQEHLTFRQKCWHLYYSFNDLADDLFWSGVYPNQAEIDGELEEMQVA